MSRNVDQAMKSGRPEKDTVRSLWLEEVQEVVKSHPKSEVPWYLTLPGAHGLDIQMLIDNGIIELTETNSIAEDYFDKIIAVERSNEAVLELVKNFTGLNIKQVNFATLVAGDGQFSWPTGEHEELCRSRIINLDFNSPINHNEQQDKITFPILEWIRKLCLIHSKPPSIDWTLCLTCNGKVLWPDPVLDFVINFLHENFHRDDTFASNCQQFLGEALSENVDNKNRPSLGTDELVKQQKLLMVFVPKFISNLVHNDGWEVRTKYNFRYGGQEEKAPMVTWIMQFKFDPESTSTPNRIYLQSLENIFLEIGFINEKGIII